jgi:5-methylcytosine-specific restriction endonuclease McrA
MICKYCKQDKPSSEFYRLKSNEPLLRNICKQCQKMINAEYCKTFHGKTSKALANARRKAASKNLSHNFTVDEWRERVLGTNGICPCCGNAVGILTLTMDHAIPFCEAPSGFTYTIDDVQPLCIKCNIIKGKLTLYFY